MTVARDVPEPLVLRPGDRLLFTVPADTAPEQLERLRRTIADRWGDNFPFLIVAGVAVTVVREET